MNITTIAAAYGSQANEAVNGKARPGKANAQQANSPSADVQISSASRDAQTVRDQIAKLPEVRIKLVDEIKQKIQRNDYPMENNLVHAYDKLFADGILA